MRRTAKKTTLLVTTAATGLAALSQCSAGLLGDLFDKHTDKDRDAIEKILPACDCSFGYFSTVWQPWGTCNQGVNTGSLNGACSASYPPALPSFQPNYNNGTQPATGASQHQVWSPPRGPAVKPDTSGPAPILMTPHGAKSSNSQDALSDEVFAPPVTEPFPRAINTNPQAPVPGSSLSPAPKAAPVPNSQQSRTLQPGAGLNAPSSSASSRSTFPNVTRNLPVPGAALSPAVSGNGTGGTGINLPPRRATSVTIDIPAGTGGTTLSLPDPTQPGTYRGRLASPTTELPANAKENLPSRDSGNPVAVPQSLNQSQPPLPTRSTLPEPEAAYQYPTQKPVTGFRPVQYASSYPATSGQLQPAPLPSFQPVKHWQPVPERSPMQQPLQTRWRVMSKANQLPGIQQPRTPVSSQQRSPAPSERVILLAPPPRR